MMYGNHENDVIIAQCTPQGVGAVALLRLSGESVFAVVEKMSLLTNNKTITTTTSHTIHYGWVINHTTQERIDQVLFLVMHAPHTFTGNNTVEITCHNNQFIINAIIQEAISCGARMALNGEFIRQAVLNNKMDILQAESINELIHANNQYHIKKSLAQVAGNLSNVIQSIEQQLLRALAFSEASFEFLDDETVEFKDTIQEILTEILITIEQLQKSFHQDNQIRQGIRIALIGSVNAGKSSFFNLLINQEKAIVTNIAGTTRDALEAGVYHDGLYWTFIDTAGLRLTDDIIESIGIKRSYKEAHAADIILLVLDGSTLLSDQESTIYQNIYNNYESKIVIIKNKSDLPAADNLFLHDKISIAVSTAHQTNISAVKKEIQNKITTLFNTSKSPFLLNQRQYNLLKTVTNNLLTIESHLLKNPDYALISYHLNDTLALLSELTGKSISDACMDEIFRQFCVGK